MDNKSILAFLAMKRYCIPFTEKDLIDAINLGKQLALQHVEEVMIGIPINGVVQSILTEEKLKELIDEKTN
jgi:hypothetical protein